MIGADVLAARTAIEALRAGVPNRAAIRALGDNEDAIAVAFEDGLAAAAEGTAGLLVAGGFGTGKSHLLGYLREAALQQNFVVSCVTISKETPLAAPRAVFAAALRGTAVPGRNDDALTVALSELQQRDGAIQALERWAASPAADLAPAFSAILHLLARPLDIDLQRRIEAFLAGGKLPTTAVRQALRQVGARGLFDLRTVSEAQLLLQRERFLPALFRAAGFAGWCVLFDEIELIGRYGPLQRALAYAELARWLGLSRESRVPGRYAAAAITEDYAQAVIHTRLDDEKLPERLRLKGQPLLAEQAIAAMRAIERARTLRAPDEDGLRRHADILRALYMVAYGWPAPPLPPGERRANRTMRHHIRGWITQWDMLRLEGRDAGIDVTPVVSGYEEDAALGHAPDEPEAED
jgi:hypothetical protein